MLPFSDGSTLIFSLLLDRSTAIFLMTDVGVNAVVDLAAAAAAAAAAAEDAAVSAGDAGVVVTGMTMG